MRTNQTTLRLTIVAVAMTMLVGCNAPPSIRSVTLSEQGRGEIRSAQTKLDEILNEHSSFVYSDLASPATENELERLRKHFDGAARPHLELWFEWHNGSKNPNTKLLPLGTTLSIDEAIEDRRINQSSTFVHASRKRDIKLLDDGCGDGFYLDMSTPTPSVYYEMLEDVGKLDYGTIPQFLGFIERVHEAGIASENDLGVTVFEDSKYSQLQNEHFRKLGN